MSSSYKITHVGTKKKATSRRPLSYNTKTYLAMINCNAAFSPALVTFTRYTPELNVEVLKVYELFPLIKLAEIVGNITLPVMSVTVISAVVFEVADMATVAAFFAGFGYTLTLLILLKSVIATERSNDCDVVF